MLRNITGVAIAASAVVILSSCCQKQPPPVLAPGLGPPIIPDPRIVYELRERCGRDAQSWFHHYFEEKKNTIPGASPMSGAFTSHYNGKANKCFAIVNSLTSIRDVKTKLTKLGTGKTLTDVLENKELGEFFKFSDMPKPMICYVGENKCDSQEGFDALAAPAMNE